MALFDFVGFYKTAREQEQKERHYQAWCSLLPHMTKENYMSFEELHDLLSGKNIDTRPASEILDEVEEIRRTLNNGNLTV